MVMTIILQVSEVLNCEIISESTPLISIIELNPIIYLCNMESWICSRFHWKLLCRIIKVRSWLTAPTRNSSRDIFRVYKSLIHGKIVQFYADLLFYLILFDCMLSGQVCCMPDDIEGYKIATANMQGRYKPVLYKGVKNLVTVYSVPARYK